MIFKDYLNGEAISPGLFSLSTAFLLGLLGSPIQLCSAPPDRPPLGSQAVIFIFQDRSKGPRPQGGQSTCLLSGLPSCADAERAVCLSSPPSGFPVSIPSLCMGYVGTICIFNELTTCIFGLSFDKTRRAHLGLIGRAEDAQDWMESWGVSLGGGLLCPVNGSKSERVARGKTVAETGLVLSTHILPRYKGRWRFQTSFSTGLEPRG